MINKHAVAVTMFSLMTISAASFAGVPFDLNSDAKVDAADINMAASLLAGPISRGGMQFPTTAGSPPVIGDFNNDRALSAADWAALINYVTVISGPRPLLDIDANGLIDVRDKAQISNAVSAARQGPYAVRYDFNGDGRTNVSDWRMFVKFMSANAPAALLDMNGDGALTGADLDLVARTVDARLYSVQFDLNADGKVDGADWAAAVSLSRQVNSSALYDVNFSGSIGAVVLDSLDNTRLATEMGAMATGWTPSVRFDLNADGIVNVADWGDWVQYVTLSARRPDLVFDLDGNGLVDASDLTTLTRNYTAMPMQVRFDVNGDGLTDGRDVALLASRLQYGPAQFALGDVNRDGCVNAADTAIIQSLTGKAAGMPGYTTAADINADGFINDVDMWALLRSSSFNKCQ